MTLENLSCQSQQYLPRLLETSIHDWQLDLGIFYGITSNAMTLWHQSTLPYLNETLRRFHSSYLEMFLFVLAQRMQLLYFAFRAATMSPKSSLDERIKLYQAYARFKSQYLSPEICPQEDAITIYHKLQACFYMEAYQPDLDDHIKSLYDIGMLYETRRESKEAKFLNRVAIGLALLAVFTSLSDFNASFLLAQGKSSNEKIEYIVFWYVSLLIGIILYTKQESRLRMARLKLRFCEWCSRVRQRLFSSK